MTNTKPSVLLVEDEPDQIQILTAQLTRDGYNIATCTNAKDIVHQAETLLPDIILLDIMLPGSSGFEILDTLRTNKKTAHIPVIALTNLAEEVGHSRAIDHGAASYVVKADNPPPRVSQLIHHLLAENRHKEPV